MPLLHGAETIISTFISGMHAPRGFGSSRGARRLRTRNGFRDRNTSYVTHSPRAFNRRRPPAAWVDRPAGRRASSVGRMGEERRSAARREAELLGERGRRHLEQRLGEERRDCLVGVPDGRPVAGEEARHLLLGRPRDGPGGPGRAETEK